MKFSIRPILLEDAAGIAALRSQPEVAERTPSLPSTRIERTEEFIKGLYANSHSFVAVTMLPGGSEKVIGMAGLTTEKNPRLRHCGGIGIMVGKDCWGLGVGSALMEKLLDMADNWLMLVRVELTAYSDNERAIHLYEKYGFVKEGVKRKAAISCGQYKDELIMARIKDFG